MSKFVRTLFLIISLLSVSASNVLAYDFLGLNPKMEEFVGGDPKSIVWDEKFLSEVEALQASILRQISVNENYWVDRQVTGVEEVIDDGWWARLFKNKKNFFALSDQLMPRSNKCANTDSDKHAILSESLDTTRMTNEVRDGKSVRVYHEFTARITGHGWKCEGKSGEEYWADDTDEKTGKVIPKEDIIQKFAVDDDYINEYTRKTKDIKHPAFDPDATEDLFYDGSNGKYFVKLQKAREYITENCVCKLKDQQTEIK